MESKIIYTSSVFKVKNPREFTKEYTDQMKDSNIYLIPGKTGFRLWGSFKVTGKENLQSKISFFQKYLRNNDVLRITVIMTNEKNRDSEICVHLISSIAYKMVPLKTCMKDIQRKLYPRFVKSQVLVKNYTTKQWIEKGKEYKALKEEKTRVRVYLIIEHKDGRRVKWPKEYFQDIA